MEHIEITDIAIDVKTAAQMWGLKQMYVKNLCANGTIKAVKLGNTWIIDKRQQNPKKYNVGGEKNV